MNEINHIISLLEKKDAISYQSALKYIHYVLKDLKDTKYALNQSSIVAITDAKGVITYANDSFCELSQFSRDELIGKTHSIVNSGYHDNQFFAYMWETIQSGQIWAGEIQNKAKDGSHYWVNTTIIPFLDSNRVPQRYIAIRTDISSQKEQEFKIHAMNYFDELTGLPNRKLYKNNLDRHLNQNNRDTEKDLAVIIFDIDLFGLVNDTLGHSAGDDVLIELGRRLLVFQLVHSSAFVSRYGGDAFILLFEHHHFDQIIKFLQEVQHQMSQPFILLGEEIFLSGSMGVATYPKDGQTADALIQHADIAMHHAKKMKMNVLFYNLDLQEEINREMIISKELRKALTEELFELYFQPKVELHSGRIIGTEALLRWNHPSLGSVSPSEFISIAEKNKLIIPIGSWVMRKAIRQNAQWHKAGHTNLTVAVNVSPLQFNNESFLTELVEMLTEYDLAAEHLEIEITENIAMENERDTLTKLQSIKEIGIQLSIDDFGSGYSSLNYLRLFNADILKIDTSFIKECTIEKDKKSIVPAIISLGHALDMKVVAEGVETVEQVEFLKKNDCDIMQGYYFARPASPQLIEALFSQTFST